MTLRLSLRDLLAGLIFIGFGLGFGIAGLNYDLGTALRMGPGYFPVVLSIIMVLLGLAIVVQSLGSGPDEVPLDAISWRGTTLILGGLVFFGVTIRGLGLVPSLFVTILMSALASRHTSVLLAVIIASVLTAMCVAIFPWALGVPLPLFGRWLPF